MADLRWDSVNANFNDVNGAMDNSIRVISQAGTVFGDLRKSILDEEQRAVDNAFREKQFDEQVSQFAATHGLNENELREQIRHNQESERLTGEGQKVQMRGQDLSHKAAMAGVGVQRDSLALAKSEQDRNALFRKDYAEITSSLYGQRDSLDQQITQGKTELEAAQAAGTITPEQLKERQAQLDRLATQRKELSDTAIQASIQREMGMRGWGGDKAIVTPSDNLAATEQARAVKGVEQSLKTQQAYEQSQVKAMDMIFQGKYTAEQSNKLVAALRSAQAAYPNVPPEVLASTLLTTTGTPYNAWLDWSGNNAFDVDDSVVTQFTKDPTNPDNLIAQAISGAARTSLSNPNNTGDIPQQRQTEQRQTDDNVNLTTLTPQALDYREQQILQSLPTVESVTKETPEVQARFDQLYRASYGNMPRSEVSASELKTLEERALQDARNTIQQMRTKATSQFSDERSRRQRMKTLYSRGYDW